MRELKISQNSWIALAVIAIIAAMGFIVAQQVLGFSLLAATTNTATTASPSGLEFYSGNGIEELTIVRGGALDEVLKWQADGQIGWGADATASITGAGSITFDAGDDTVFESTGLTAIATTGDTNSVFTESGDKLTITVSNNWPTADLAATATALAANGANCIAGQFNKGVDASGAAETCAALLDSDVPNSITITLAATATALAANGANCAANTFNKGVDASGAAETCAALVDADVPDSITITLSATATALAANPTDCGAGTKADSIDASGNLTCSAVGSADISDNDLLEVDLKVVDAPGDEECLTYEVTGGDFEWQACSGATSNSFETQNVPSGTDPVADSATDTLNWTSTGSTVSLTGDSGTDTINIEVLSAPALSADPTDCGASTFATAIAANGNLTCASIVDADVPDSITITLAATATALAANPTDCGTNTKADAIDASGNLTCSAVDTGDLTDNDILEIDLKVVDAPGDEECLTYEATGGDFEWQSCGGVDLVDDGDGTTATTASESGLELTVGELSIIRGCANGEIVKWVSVTEDWVCSADSTGGSPTFDSIASGTNTTADMTVGSGSQILLSVGGVAQSSILLNSFNNDSGATLFECTAVYVSGFDIPSDLPELAIADADATGPAVGLIFADVTNGADGFVVLSGSMEGLDTTTGEGWSVGDSLYLNDSGTSADSDCGNTLTNVRPANTDDEVQKVAVVERIHAVSGRVKIVGAGRANDVPNIADDNIWIGSATNVATATAISDCNTSNYDRLQYDTATNTISCDTDTLGSTDITDGDLLEIDLKAVDAAVDEECLTYEATGGDFEWQACGSSQNLFETMNAPLGTDPVADSTTDTLNFDSPNSTIAITGSSSTDTLSFDVLTAPALSTDPTDCGANAFAIAIDASGNLACASIVDADVPDSITITLASTATALAADPTDCGANAFAISIVASGNLTCASIVDADVPDSITITLAATATALAADPTDCGANTKADSIDASGNLTCSAVDTGDITDNDILEIDLKAVDAAVDEECLTYEATGGDFEWQACSGAAANSFETIDVPTGTDPVATSSTDTLTLTSPLGTISITGSASNTIGFDAIDVSCTGCIDTTKIAQNTIAAGDVDYTNLTLASDPALEVDECFWTKDGAIGGGFLCEGSINDTNEQLYLFPDVNDADTTETIVTTGSTGTVNSTMIVDGSVVFPDINYTQTLAGNPTFAAEEVYFGDDGVLFEGATADTIEGLLTVVDPTTTDKTWTLPDVDGTIITTGDTDTVTSTMILDGDLLEIDLKAVDAAVDEECLTYEATGGDFEWQTCGGAGANSFETWNPPLGTDPVASSSSDTMILDSPNATIAITGTAASDTLSFDVLSAPALSANPTDCAANTFATTIAANGNLTCASIVDADVPDSITITLAATATALAADPTDCGANAFAISIVASGNLTCATIVDADVPDSITISLAAAATALAADPTDCGAGTFADAIAASGNLTCNAVVTGDITDGTILPIDLDDGADVQADEECLTYEGTGSIFEWQSCGGASQNLFETFTGTAGTSPVADSATDTLTMDSPDGTVAITGTAASDLLSFSVLSAPVLTANGANCVAGEFNKGVDAAGAVEACAALLDSDIPNNITIDLAATATALAANGANCIANQFNKGVDASGAAESCAALVDADVPDSITISLAATATALAADPTDCGANSFAISIVASGNLTCATIVDADVPDSITITLAATATALAADPADCGAGTFADTINASGTLGCNAVVTGDITDGTILPIDLDDAADVQADEECLTYEGTGAIFEWQACGGAAQNLFETFTPIVGTAPVADSATDTLTLDSPAGTITITGTAASDLLSFDVLTAPALSANGTNCAANTFNKGVDAAGNAETCAALVDADVPDSITISLAATATALAANPADCAVNEFAQSIVASGNLTCAAIVDADVPDSITITLAATATALAADPTDCGANAFAISIVASGNLTCATLVDADIPDSITISLAATATALAANGANCTANQFNKGVDASGAAETCALLVDADVPDSITIALAATATALAADPTDCGAGTFADAIAASGNLTCNAVVTGDITDGTILPIDLDDAADVQADEECLTYEATGAIFEWQSCSGTAANSFETQNALTGTDPVAESSTDTLNWTSTGSTMTIVGDSATDTINLEAVDVTCTGCLGTTEIAGLDVSDDINLTAGRSLTLTGDDVLADAELYTDTHTIWFENPTAADDFNTIWVAVTNTYTFTAISCESDQTVTFDLQVDDGTPTGVNGSDITCTTFATDSTLAGDTELAAGERLDLAITSVSGTPTWVSISWTVTKND